MIKFTESDPEDPDILIKTTVKEMTMRKKIVTGLFLLAAAAMAAGCGKKEAEQAALDDKTLPEIIDRIYEEKDPGLAVATAEVDLTDADALKYSTGLDSPEGIEAAAVSEAMISAQAYSMVLVRTEDSKNTEETARAMQEGIDPAKWICVQADDMEVSGYGDVALLIMVSSELSESVTAEEITEAFQTVCGGKLAFEL